MLRHGRMRTRTVWKKSLRDRARRAKFCCALLMIEGMGGAEVRLRTLLMQCIFFHKNDTSQSYYSQMIALKIQQ